MPSRSCARRARASRRATPSHCCRPPPHETTWALPALLEIGPLASEDPRSRLPLGPARRRPAREPPPPRSPPGDPQIAAALRLWVLRRRRPRTHAAAFSRCDSTRAIRRVASCPDSRSGLSESLRTEAGGERVRRAIAATAAAAATARAACDSTPTSNHESLRSQRGGVRLTYTERQRTSNIALGYPVPMPVDSLTAVDGFHLRPACTRSISSS